MALPAPNLDDRRFQDLVDEAKLFVSRRCPEWTDHNVSDPGVTMIELFASMVDQLVYRLNQVPARNYVKFLQLIGVDLLPPADAECDVTFWLSAPQSETVPIPVGTEVATMRTETEEPVTFSVIEHLDVLPCSLARAGCVLEPGNVLDYTDELAARRGFYCFDRVPKVDDALLVGLSGAVPRCALRLAFDCEIEGVGVDPLWPPVAWEAWTGDGWSPCEVDHDDTGGLNRAGEVVLHVPAGHVESVMGGQRAGWIRCRVVEAAEGQPVYSASPRIVALEAATVGGTTAAAHSVVVQDEIVGLSEGVPGQRFRLRERPVVPTGRPMLVEVAGGDGWEQWHPVDNFGDCDETTRAFVLDAVEGEIVFGPAVRMSDGSLRQYGAVPPKGAPIRVPSYRAGGGRRGNVARGTLTVLKSSIPYIARVENRRAAVGGVDAEDIEAAKVRGPIVLRTRNRAVTAEDYEVLAKEAAPDVARVRCVPAGEDGTDAGTVRVLVVPAVGDETTGRLRFEELVPPEEMLAAIAAYLDERRVVGTRVVVEPPVYQGMTVVARLRARPRFDPARLQATALTALYRYFHPLIGGPDQSGWPFGRPIHVGEVYSVLQRVPGVEFVEDARLFGADPITGARGDQTQRIDIGPNALVFSYEHQVLVQ
jgi:predicted phage baseplate assembly protein